MVKPYWDADESASGSSQKIKMSDFAFLKTDQELIDEFKTVSGKTGLLLGATPKSGIDLSQSRQGWMGNRELASARTFSIAIRETCSRSLEVESGQEGRYSAEKLRKWAKNSKLWLRFLKSLSQARNYAHEF